MKLYFNPRSRAVIAKWMLDESGIDYELVHIDFEKREHKSPAIFAVNPSGKLPALQTAWRRSSRTSPSACISATSTRTHALLPPSTRRNAAATSRSWCKLEPSMGDHLLGLQTDPQRGWTAFETTRDVVEHELGDGPYLFDDWFTAADVMIGSMFIWKRLWGGPPERPKLRAYVDRLMARPKAMKL